MKLEYLPEGSPVCPLVRVYDYLPAEIARLSAAMSALAIRTVESLPLHALPGVEAIDGCRLILRTGTRNRGLVKLSNPIHFYCVLKPEGWEDLAALIEPMLQGGQGYQWLSTDGDANWLLSKDGCW